MYYVYILANKRGGTLYVGITSNLVKRIYEHKNDLVKSSFTCKYRVHNLVFFEASEDITVATNREKSLKRWPRRWKLKLIEDFNPNWEDLYKSII